ncbi:MAG: hypothetical protein AYK18_05440 [Theionarchaea archaeon DG-70]|nr:MAG: hypothetical protein AYK18_05440 [Theionarchaea archaeon DG-70]
MNESSLRVRALEHCNQKNPIYSTLKHYVEVHEEGGEVTADTQDILIVDSKTVLIDEKDTYRKLLEILFGKGGSILFLDLDEETKQSLNEYTGFYSSGDSYAFFVSAKKDLLEKIELHMYEIKSKDEYEESESLSSSFEESEKKTTKEEWR